MHVAYHTDHGVFRTRHIDLEVLPDRIAIGPEAVRGGAADERDERPICAIRVVESAAAKERNANGAEIIGRRRAVVSRRWRVCRQTGNRQATCAIAGKKRQTARGADSLNARNASK